MSKGYWVACYRSISDEAAVAKYASVAGPILQSLGGRILARGTPAKAYESGLNQRTVVIEFDSVEAAIAAYENPKYQAAVDILRNAAERDIRIIPGV